MRQLNLNELSEVNGGVLPIIIAGAIASSKGLATGFALGVAVGSIWALVD